MNNREEEDFVMEKLERVYGAKLQVHSIVVL